jgi:four helix bundle protein
LSVGSETGTIKRQLVRAATSVGANYRAARRARSRKDFISKLSIVEEEADECVYWLSLLGEMGCDGEELTWLKGDANEIVAIIVASKKTARSRL